MDQAGNILVKPGRVVDLKSATSTFYEIGTGEALVTPNYGFGIRAASDDRQIFIGGNGYAIESAGSVSGTLAPIGKFIQSGQYEWQDVHGHVVTFDPATGDASIYDENDVEVATFSDPSATIAPVGTFTATVDGEDIYNGGSAFTVASTYEGGGTPPSVEVFLSAGTAQSGTYSPTATWGQWESDDDPDWKIEIYQDKTINLMDPSYEIVATGTALAGVLPDGSYDSTTYGSSNYNSGETFVFTASSTLQNPIAGYVWIELELSSGNLVGATGPFWNTSLPANSSTLEVVPIAYSDGNGKVIQIHEGPIFWR